MVEYLMDFARHRNIPCYEDDAGKRSGSEAGNVIMTLNGGGSTLFMSHMDTARSTENLKPILREDRITSDGYTVLGVDNRLGTTALLAALDQLLSLPGPHPGFTLVFTICEETTLAGSTFLQVPENITQAYAFDSSYRPGKYIRKAPGAMYFDVEVLGKAAHSGIAPEDGINALHLAAKAISSLPLGRVDDDSTMNIGPFSCTAATNVVPPKVSFKGEFRSTSVQRVEELNTFLSEHFKESFRGTGAKYRYEAGWDFHPYSFEEEAPILKRLEKAIEAVGLIPQGITSYGGSDVNVMNGKGIPAVNLGIGAQNPHSNDEFVLYEDLMNTSKLALELFQNET